MSATCTLKDRANKCHIGSNWVHFIPDPVAFLVARERGTGEAGLIPGPGRSPGEENGNPLQYSCHHSWMGSSFLNGIIILEWSHDRGTWRATVHGVTQRGHDCTTQHMLGYVCWFARVLVACWFTHPWSCPCRRTLLITALASRHSMGSERL